MADFILKDVFPSKRIHLIGGASNVGKTRWILPAMADWCKGRPIMGFTSYPRPWAYVSGDRMLIEAQESIRGLGLSVTDIPIIPAFGRDNKNWAQVLATAARDNVEVLVWEGFGDLAPDPQRKGQVRDFLGRISAFCCENPDFPHGLTILGVMETPKMKPYERYSNPRERISGVASWGYHTSSVLLLEAGNDKDPSDPSRVLYASLKNAPSFTSLGAFNRSGQLHFGLPEIMPVMDDTDIEGEVRRMRQFIDDEARKRDKV